MRIHRRDHQEEEKENYDDTEVAVAVNGGGESSLEEPLLSPPPSADDEIRIVDGLPFKTSVLIKSLYFLDALGSSTWGRFSAIYYNLHGLNSQHIGIIEGARTAIPTFSMVFWGIVADRYRARKKVWLTTKTISTVVLLQLALPYIYSSFPRILIVSILAQLFVSSGVLDAYTLDLLGTRNKMYYGRYRLYASLSWGLGSIFMGWVTDHYGFEPNFILFALLGSLMVILVATHVPEMNPNPSIATTSSTVQEEPPPSAEDSAEDTDNNNNDGDNNNDNNNNDNNNNNNNHAEENSGKITDLICLALRPRVFSFLLEIVIMGAGMATVERLLFLYLVNDLKASNILCGLSVGVNVLFELPIFWYASKFMAILGHDGMFLLAMSCFVLRVYGYTLLTPSTRWFILLLEVMHGITFACFWIVSTDISKVLVHQTKGALWSTAIPSSVQMLYSAFGVSLGSVLGGWAMKRYGSREMYKFTARVVFATLLFHLVGSILSRIFCKGSSFLPNYKLRSENEENHTEEESGGADGSAIVHNTANQQVQPHSSDDDTQTSDQDIET